MTEREANNRKIAEWLESLSSLPNEDDSEEMQAYESEAWIATFRLSRVTGMHVPAWEPRDYYTDEVANAMVLEKMPSPELYRCRFTTGFDRWYCRPDVGIERGTLAGDPVEAEDRKTAIVNAALALIDRAAEKRVDL